MWQQLPYLTEEMVGTGVYALSEPGRHRFDRFPDLTADDQFVLQQFARRERRSLPDEHFVVHTPTTLKGLVAIRKRAYRGTSELEASGVPHGKATGAGRRLLELASSPRNWFPVAVLRDHLGDRQAPGPLRRWPRLGAGRLGPPSRGGAAGPMRQQFY